MSQVLPTINSSLSGPTAHPIHHRLQNPDDERIPDVMTHGSAGSSGSANVSDGAARVGATASELGDRRQPFDRGHNSVSEFADADSTTDESSTDSADDADVSPATILKLPLAYFGGEGGSPTQRSTFDRSLSEPHLRQVSTSTCSLPSNSSTSGQDGGVHRLVLLAKHPNADEEQIQRVLRKKRQQQQSRVSAAVRKGQIFRQQQERQELHQHRQGQQQPPRLPGGLRVAFQEEPEVEEGREEHSFCRHGLSPCMQSQLNGSFKEASQLSAHRTILRHPSLPRGRTDDENDFSPLVVSDSGGLRAGEVFHHQAVFPNQTSFKGDPKVNTNDEEQTRPMNSTGHRDTHGTYCLTDFLGGKILPVDSSSSVLPSTASISSDFEAGSTTTVMDNKSLASRLSVISYSSEKTRKINNLSLHQSSCSPNPDEKQKGFMLSHLTSTRKGIVILVLTLILAIALVVTTAAALGGRNNGQLNSSSSSQEAGSLPGHRLPTSYFPSSAPSILSASTLTPTPKIPTMLPVEDVESPAVIFSTTAEPTPPVTSTLSDTENSIIFTGVPSVSPTTVSGALPPAPAPTLLRQTSAPTSHSQTGAENGTKITAEPSVNPTVPAGMVPSPPPLTSPITPPTSSSLISVPVTMMPTLALSSSPTVLPFDSWTWTDKGQILEGNQANQRFGQAVAISDDGRTLVIGAPFSSVNGLSNAGMVQIFQWNSGSQLWSPFGLLLGRNSGDQFGSSIALSADGNVLAVSEPTFDGKAGDRSGNVRVFINSPFKGFIQLGQDLEGSNATDSSGIGLSLSATGRRLAVGEPYHDFGNDNENSTRLVSGQAKVYEWSVEENVWIAIGSVPIRGTNHLDWFGWSLSLNDDGSFLCVGAPRNLEFGGYVQCFEETENGDTGTIWQQAGDTIRNELSPVRYEDKFGSAVKVSRDPTGLKHRVAIGAPGKNADTADSGAVLVYEYDPLQSNANQWRQLGGAVVADSPGIGLQLGMSVDLEGDLLAVGIPGAGEVNIYHLVTTTENTKQEWSLNPVTFQGTAGSTYGGAVHITVDGTIVIGSGETGDDTNAGIVNVYRTEHA